MNQRQLKLVISFIVTKASDMKIMSQYLNVRAIEKRRLAVPTLHT